MTTKSPPDGLLIKYQASRRSGARVGYFLKSEEKHNGYKRKV